MSLRPKAPKISHLSAVKTIRNANESPSFLNTSHTLLSLLSTSRRHHLLSVLL